MLGLLKNLFTKTEKVPEQKEVAKPSSRSVSLFQRPADYAEIMSYEDWFYGDFGEDDGMGFFIDSDGWELPGLNIFAGNPYGYEKVAWYSK